MQSLIFILLLGTVQAALLSIFFLHKRLHRQGYFFLVLYVSTIFLQLTFKLISKAWLIQHFNVVYALTYQLPFLYGPFIYLFVRQLYTKVAFKPVDVLHFIPFSIVLFHFALVDPNEYPLTWIRPFFSPYLRLSLQIISLIGYHLVALRTWRNVQKGANQSEPGFYRPQVKWIRSFIYSSFVITTLVSVTIYYMYIYFPVLQPVRFAFAGLTIFVYWVSYSALYQPQLFSAIKGTNVNAIGDQIPRLTIHRPAKKYANSNLSSMEGDRILLKLTELVMKQKLYLDPNISLEQMATKIGCSKHHLSQVINEKLSQSFYDYINYFRVEEVKSMLASQQYQDYKIASIAYDAGFNSLSAFNEVFKKFIGCTPSAYRKQPAQQSQKERV